MGLVEQYDILLDKYTFIESCNVNGIYRIVRDSLDRFVSGCENPAIWCYGNHTRMLMADFMFEMKKVKYIIDENYEKMTESGFHILGSQQIQDSGIDGIIISSYLYKEEIKNIIKRDYPDMSYLDLYEELEKQGVILNYNYYARSHPYHRYQRINYLKREVGKDRNLEKIYQNIVSEYINIKDFRSAAEYAEKLAELTEKPVYHELKNDLEKIYQLELSAVSGISENNVIMFCIDGLRRQDVLGNCMPNLKQYLIKNTRFYENAYAVSTSTFESLIPTYSENSDLRTRYYESNAVSEKSCRFFQEAVKQNRNIFFYTDSDKFIDTEAIKFIGDRQTASEKIWNFALDAEKEGNGLFYIHVLYEGHYSYPNPDTEEELIADGSNIMFDYLERNGGRLRTDYERQHMDALRYLDRVLPPVLERIPCRLVLYADHGNILMPPETLLDDIEAAKYSYHEDLIQIPLAIKAPEVETGTSSKLMSLMSLNEVICSLLKREAFTDPDNDFVKIQRSEIYNPDFKFLYGKAGKQQELKAFEAFIFRDGRKLVVYSDGLIRLCDRNDELIQDQNAQEELWHKVKPYVTVTC